MGYEFDLDSMGQASLLLFFFFPPPGERRLALSLVLGVFGILTRAESEKMEGDKALKGKEQRGGGESKMGMYNINELFIKLKNKTFQWLKCRMSNEPKKRSSLD